MICRTVAHGRVILAERHARFGLILPNHVCRKWQSVKGVEALVCICESRARHLSLLAEICIVVKKEAMLNTSHIQIPNVY